MNTTKPYRILLGGIGGDSHSVGLIVLRHALTNAGYEVLNLGIQNKLVDFFRFAGDVHLVMISSMDGHAWHYLREFPERLNAMRDNRPLWYLGGNFHERGAKNSVADFMEMGFDRVFLRQVKLDGILETTARDLSRVIWTPMPPAPPLHEHLFEGEVTITDKEADHEAMLKLRPKILQQWHTGAQAMNLQDNAMFLSQRPNFPAIMAKTLRGEQTMVVQPRCGVSLPEDQERIFKGLSKLGLEALSYQIDSLTRNNNYQGAEEEIRASRELQHSTLNGFPMVNIGVEALRRISLNTGVALQTRHSTRDPRLLAEISYAGGVSSYEGGPICYNIPYYKNYPLEEALEKWRYVDWLTGHYYREFGIVIDREYFGTLTATLIPPSLAIVTGIIEALLSVSQGVCSVSIGYAEQGNREQDIAAIRAIDSLAHRWLTNLGYEGVQVNTIFHQYMAAFPENHKHASELIYQSGLTAAASGATRILTKTAVEAIRIPSLQDNADAITLVQQAAKLGHTVILNETRIAEEQAWIEREVEAMMTATLVVGDGDLARGTVMAFRKGLIDIPFSPSIHNRGEVVTVRDLDGAVRFYHCGQLPLDKETRQFHSDRIAERASLERWQLPRDITYMIQRDVTRLATDPYFQWPFTRAN